jgi:hypothetical protein
MNDSRGEAYSTQEKDENAHKILAGKHEEKTSLGSPGRRSADKY